MLRPLNGRVLIKPDEKGEKITKSGIVLQEKEEIALTGTVISGNEVVSEGERVLFSRFGIDEYTEDEQKYYVVSTKALLAKL